MKMFVFPPTSIDTTGLSTEAKQDAIITELQNLEVSVGDIDVNTDGLEALVTTSNSTLSSISADTSSLDQKVAAALVPELHDYIGMTYVGSTTKINTVTYKVGGASGTTVATLTMAYDGSDRLTSVTRS